MFIAYSATIIDPVTYTEMIQSDHQRVLPTLVRRVTAVVVRTPGASVDELAIREALEERLAKFKQPKRVFFVEALPRNATGKLTQAALRALLAGGASRTRP